MDHRTEIENLTLLALALRTRSDDGLTLETSAFQSLSAGPFTLSTLLINQIFVFQPTAVLVDLVGVINGPSAGYLSRGKETLCWMAQNSLGLNKQWKLPFSML